MELKQAAETEGLVVQTPRAARAIQRHGRQLLLPDLPHVDLLLPQALQRAKPPSLDGAGAQ